MRMILAVVAAVMVLVMTSVAVAKPRSYTVLELAEQSEVVFSGTVTGADRDAATIKVGQVLQGKLEGETVVVKPSMLREDGGQAQNFKAGESVLIFGKHGAGQEVTIVADGRGKIALTDKTREMELGAARRLVAVAALKEEHDKNLAMLGEATSDNALLRADARTYIALRLAYGKGAERYKEQLVAFLASEDAGVQRTGLEGLRFVEAGEAVPRMIELSRSADLGVVDSASLTLGRYDTAEAVGALVALTGHANEGIRCRACIDLSQSQRAEAKAAIAGLMEDKSARVRASAASGLVFSLRAGKADDLLGKLAGLLKDADEEVRARAAYALGETRNVAAIGPLVEALSKEGVSRGMQYAALGALYCHYSKDGRESRPLVEKQMDLVIAALKADKETAGFGPAFQAVGILALCREPAAKAALEWAAESHPSEEIRGYAKRELGRK